MPPAPSSLPSPPVVQQQPKPSFSFNAQGHVSSPPAFGGASTISSTLTSPFGSAPSVISSPSQPGAGQTFTFNASAGGGGAGVPSQNVTSMSHAPSFAFGSTPDSQVQQQRQPSFSFGAGSEVGGQSGMAFGQVSYLFIQATGLFTTYSQSLSITRFSFDNSRYSVSNASVG